MFVCLNNLMALKRADCLSQCFCKLLGAGILGDSLGAFAHGVFGELARKEKPDSGLDLPRGDGRLLVVLGKARGFGGDALEDIVHEAIHYTHGLAGDAGVRMDLFQDLVDVDAIRLLPLLSATFLVIAFGVGLGRLGNLHSLSTTLRRHLG